MFTKSSQFYDALYHFKDYKAASDKLAELITSHNPGARTILDTACGTGKHIEHLKDRFDAEGLDLNEELLEIARKRCPENNFYHGDMTDFELGKKYDVVTCLFSSIAYVKTLPQLNKAVASMAKHLNEKGLLIIEPWFSKETYWTDRVTVNHFEKDTYKITWMYTSKLENGCSVLDINYLVGVPDSVTHFKERHELGLFSDEQYRKAFTDAGLKVSYDKEGLFGRGMYTGVKE